MYIETLWNEAWNDPMGNVLSRHTFFLWPYMVLRWALQWPLNIRWCWCIPMCHWLRDITLSSNVESSTTGIVYENNIYTEQKRTWKRIFSLDVCPPPSMNGTKTLLRTRQKATSLSLTVKCCSHSEIATAIYLLQRMSFTWFNFVVAIEPCEHIKDWLHGVIVTVIYLSQLIGCMRFSVIVAIATVTLTSKRTHFLL